MRCDCDLITDFELMPLFHESIYLYDNLQVISSSLRGCEIVASTEVSVDVKYKAVNSVSLKALAGVSTYCMQEMFIGCGKGTSLSVEPPYGWFTVSGTRMPYWAGNTGWLKITD